MHTVPRGYLAGFADPSAAYEKPHVWRFEREATEPKLVGVRKTSALTDVYTLWTETSKPDVSIETELLDKTVENGFPGLVALLDSGKEPSYLALAPFVAVCSISIVANSAGFPNSPRRRCHRGGERRAQ